MSIINHKMLSLARESRGKTQTDLTTDLKISQGNYSRMEKGLLPLTEELLNKIANYLNFPVSFFSRVDSLITQSEYFYRKKASLGKKDEYQLEAQFDLIRMWFEDLLHEVELDSDIPALQVIQYNTPETIARKIRAYFGIDKGPIIDLVRAIEKRGIIVHYIKAPEKFSGTTVITKSDHKIIVINSDLPNYVKRFTIAHELGHIIMHIPAFQFLADSQDDLEKEANRFAAEFLMPENEISRDLSRLTYSKLADLKLYWKVSKSALIRRAFDTSNITPEKYQNLMIELSRFNERKQERNDVTLDDPALVRKIIRIHCEQLNYNIDEIRSNMSISKNDFDDIVNTVAPKIRYMMSVAV